MFAYFLQLLSRIYARKRVVSQVIPFHSFYLFLIYIISFKLTQPTLLNWIHFSNTYLLAMIPVNFFSSSPTLVILFLSFFHLSN